MSRLVLAAEPFDSPVAVALIAAVQQEYVARYGAADLTPVDAAQFAPPRGVFLVAWLDGVPVGCGGWRQVDRNTVEVKRMYVAAFARGRGVARALLAELEEMAARRGHGTVRLETGTAQPEAIALYTAAGYRPTAPFGVYQDEPDCRCFAKALRLRATG